MVTRNTHKVVPFTTYRKRKNDFRETFGGTTDEISSEDVTELRRALVRTQKQLKESKNRTEELVEATKQAAYDATLAMGPVTDVIAPSIDKRKRIQSVRYGI